MNIKKFITPTGPFQFFNKDSNVSLHLFEKAHFG